MGKIKVLQQSSWPRRLAFAEAVIFLGVARLALLLFSFQRLLRFFGLQIVPEIWDATAVSAPREPAIRQVAEAIRRCARHVPWQSLCLVQALAGRAMLARRGLAPNIWLGVAKEPQQAMEAHAWLVCDQQFVTGSDGYERFVPTACFSPRDHAY